MVSDAAKEARGTMASHRCYWGEKGKNAVTGEKKGGKKETRVGKMTGERYATTKGNQEKKEKKEKKEKVIRVISVIRQKYQR